MGEIDPQKVQNWFQTQRHDSVPPTPSAAVEALRASRPPTADEDRAYHRAQRAHGVPLPPQELIDWVGGGDSHVFQTVGLLNVWQLQVYCGFDGRQRVLEPGCGCGRNARYLAPALGEEGGYEGFDIHRPSIHWATAEITSRFANVRFAFADIRNTNYNPTGAHGDEDFTFPYESGRFDLVFLPSVFTHLTRAGFERYAAEIARVLVPGGRCLSWHFLLDDQSRDRVAAGTAAVPLQRFDDVSSVLDPDNPCAAIAFDEAFVLDSLAAVGLRAQGVVHGTWSGRRPDGVVDAQDRIVTVRAAQ